MSDCLDDDVIASLSAGALDEGERASLTAHIDACDPCRALVAEVARARELPPGEEAPAPRLPGDKLGRYVVLATVGAGAMGVVYAAWDPELGRKVALKVLRTDPFAKGSSGAQRQRLLREAQSLAKLSHPNVITIHDVGVIDGEVFLAMELVEEGTLGDWLRAEPRRWRTVLAMMRQAGEGLAAAHAAGLVHRDFKPENVLVDAYGRPRVTDFGLARNERILEALPSGAASDGREDRVTGRGLTLTGALMGTPAYMAPELLAGGVADARSDQFAFCATLHEALYGERPFAGTDVPSLASSIARGDLRVGARAARARVPAWLRRLVVRGLSVRPDDCFASMRALLDALAKGPLLSSSRLAAAGIAAAVLALGLAASRRSPPPTPCVGDDAAWGDVWSAEDAEAVRRSFGATRAPFAESSFASVERGLGAYRAAWTTMHHDACVATRVERSQSEAMLDLRMVCLEVRRREAAALVSVFAAADEKTTRTAPSAVDNLPSIASCAETPELLAEDPPPREPEKRAELARLEGESMRVIAFETASRWPECASLVATLLPAARALAYRPLEARITMSRGVCRIHTPAGKEDLQQAALLALLAHDDATVADAWIWLARAGYPIAPAEGEMWARYAEAAIARLGGDDVREVNRLKWLAMNREVMGRLDEAEEAARRDYDLATRVFGVDEPRTITPMEVLANVLGAEDRMDETLTLQRRILAARARIDGPDSPSLLVSTLNEGEDLDAMGRSAEAVAIYRRALARWDAGPYVSYAVAILGAALRHQGLFAEALVEDRRALATATAPDADPQERSRPLTGVGLDLLGLGRAKEAVPSLEAAVASAYGEEDFTEDALFGLARALWEAADAGGGNRRRAREVAGKAREKVRGRAEKYGGRFKRQLDAVEEWLRSHG